MWLPALKSANTGVLSAPTSLYIDVTPYTTFLFPLPHLFIYLLRTDHSKKGLLSVQLRTEFKSV